jgi:hypothetical protein
MPEGGERPYEIGMDEAWKVNMKQMAEMWAANIKRTYDEYQQVSLEGIKNQQKYQEKVLSDAQQHDNARQVIANQALQNAVETANMVSKQAVRHADIAIDRQWNVDEVAQLVAQTSTFKDAIAAAVAAAVNEALAKK